MCPHFRATQKNHSPLHIRSHKRSRRHRPQCIAVRIVAQNARHRCARAQLAQLLHRKETRIDVGTQLVEIPIAASQTRKLIGYDLGKCETQQSVGVRDLQQAAHPQIDVIGMAVDARQFVGVVVAEFLEVVDARVAGRLQIVVVAADAVIATALHIDGGQIEADGVVAAEEEAAQL